MMVKCPNCKDHDALLIIYGIAVDPESLAQMERGEALPGGCFFGEDFPTHQCLFCEHQFIDPVAKAERDAWLLPMLES